MKRLRQITTILSLALVSHTTAPQVKTKTEEIIIEPQDQLATLEATVATVFDTWHSMNPTLPRVSANIALGIPPDAKGLPTLTAGLYDYYTNTIYVDTLGAAPEKAKQVYGHNPIYTSAHEAGHAIECAFSELIGRNDLRNLRERTTDTEEIAIRSVREGIAEYFERRVSKEPDDFMEHE